MSQQLVGYHLSPQQRQLWKLGKGRGPFYSACELLIEGSADARQLRRAVESVVERHEILRTRYEREGGLAVALQVVDDRVNFSWSEEDLSAHAPAEQEQKLAARYARESASKREGAGGLSVNLFDLGAGRRVMQLSLTALSADARTLADLVGEIASACADTRSGEPSEELLQYAQFSEWQTSLLEDEEAEESRNFWRTHAGLASPSPSLPFEALHEGGLPQEFFTHRIELGTGLLKAVEAVAAKHETTTDVILLACWQTLLWRLTGQPDVTIGCVFDGRNFEELRGTLGLMSKCLPVHLRFGDGLSFAELIRPLGDSFREAHKRQEYFDWEATATSREGVGAQAPFLPFCFESEHWPSPDSEGANVFRLRRHYSCFNPFKIKLACMREGASFSAQFYYDPRLFSATQLRRLAAQYKTLLSNATTNPEAAAAELEILGDDERRELLLEFNATAEEFGPALCVQELFERQAEATPDAVALLYPGGSMSYAELNASANRFAHHLRKLGVGPDVLVGVCIGRRPELVAALLGILKAGGAYVPLEPTYPAERLRYMLEDSRAGVIVTEQEMDDVLPVVDARRVCVDRDREAIELESSENPQVEVAGANLAYVIYTSGSTGRPKGVCVEHSGFANYVNWSARAYRVAEGEGAPLHSPLGFDLTVTSLYPQLIAGRSVRLAPEQKGIEALVESLKATGGYSLVKITPAHLDAARLLLRPEETTGVSRAFVIGGEALREESLDYWREHAPATRLINEYGPTETVVGCCVFDASAEGERERAERAAEAGVPTHKRGRRAYVPIGHPIANTRLYVADEMMRPAASGMAGELYVGGAGVARGYLNRPDLTAEKFLPDPWATEPGARVYRTGDLALHLGEVGLEFLGRGDEQVKVRGFRIELGEIEAALAEQPGVKQCKVIARGVEGEEKTLVAYVVGEGPGAASAEELGRGLRELLPEYMIPVRFVGLAALPLTPNGKVDVRALPAPPDAGAELEAEYVAPRNAVEEALAGMWAEVLKVERVGVRDNFFLLGGHSLLVIQVMARIRETFQIELEPGVMFEAATIEALASELIAREARPGQAEKIALILKRLSAMTDEDAGAELNAKQQVTQ
ncbi:MAG: hypothetical protein QOH49_3583 [Acidobacteriota bacterium]|jgi:amino acid adenylation domain-containing protein|nr:hypothetical protein [Acidobacteriota bacterium]